jgi:5-methyltetrahydrofolate--homocysteine methyltransferase
MIIVGELINASRKSIAGAIENGDESFIKAVARDQAENGAHYIDVNAGVFIDKESEYLKWLVTQVQQMVDIPCCIDSPNPKAIEAALSVYKGTAMINSISLEKNRYESILSLVAGTDLKVVALCASDEGLPKTVEDRMSIAERLVNGLSQKNVPLDNIYIDPLVQPISTNNQFGIEFLNTVEKIMTTFKGIHTICGLSNISFGLPERKILNHAFLIMAIAKGLDAAVINPLDRRLMAGMFAAEALKGEDGFCKNYITAYRAKKFEF